MHVVAWWKYVLLWPLALLVRLWGMTLRVEASPEDRERLSKRDVPMAVVLWHNRLFLASEVYHRFRKPRPTYALISASKDGALLVAFFSMVGGMRAARGSSNANGREAANALVELQRAGHDLGITPDGPKGPRYVLKPGVVIVPRRTGAPLLLLGIDIQSAWRVKSWDRFYIPKPFSKVRLRGEIIENHELADRDAALAHIQARLLALNPDDEFPGTGETV